MESIVEAPVRKMGLLDKLGGGAGGHRNWKARWTVLSDHLYYYESQATYQKNPKQPIGRVILNAFFCSKSDDSSSFEFVVNAYPKSMVLRAQSAAEMEEWLAAIMAPLVDLQKVPADEEAAPAAASAEGGAAAAAGGAAAGGAGSA